MPVRGRVDEWAAAEDALLDQVYDGDGAPAYELGYRRHREQRRSRRDAERQRAIQRGKYSDEQRGSSAPFCPKLPTDAQIEAANAPRDPLLNFARWLIP